MRKFLFIIIFIIINLVRLWKPQLVFIRENIHIPILEKMQKENDAKLYTYKMNYFEVLLLIFVTILT